VFFLTLADIAHICNYRLVPLPSLLRNYGQDCQHKINLRRKQTNDKRHHTMGSLLTGPFFPPFLHFLGIYAFALGFGRRDPKFEGGLSSYGLVSYNAQQTTAFYVTAIEALA
jgi:hypothetical protein